MFPPPRTHHQLRPNHCVIMSTIANLRSRSSSNLQGNDERVRGGIRLPTLPSGLQRLLPFRSS